jgi:uncharacterized protein (DUF1778 family)
MSPRRERLQVRLSAEHKALIERAARAKGQSLSTFVVSALLERARQIDVHVLTGRDWRRFLEIMDRGEAPTKALAAAATRAAR